MHSTLKAMGMDGLVLEYPASFIWAPLATVRFIYRGQHKELVPE
jgi:hypothetical protein